LPAPAQPPKGSNTSRRGKRLAAEKKFDEAILEYRNAIRTDDRFGEARWRLAQAYEETENFQGARCRNTSGPQTFYRTTSRSR
jgi:Flp pilus assembly protein TadD